jgi:hypothetical protein
MKKLLLLLLLPALLFAQPGINKKHISYVLASGGASAPSTNLSSVSVSFKTVQYTNDPLDLVATPNVSVTNASWQVRDMETDVLYGLAEGNSVSIPITRSGLYKLVYSATTSTDAVFNQTFDDILVLPPRFTEAEATDVIDTDDGNHYTNYASAANPGRKILIKGSGAVAGYVALLNLWGDNSNGFESYARIQIEPGLTNVIQNGVSGSNGLDLEGARYVIFDGNKDDGTPGYEIRQPAGGAFDVRLGNSVFTHVVLTGIYTNRQGYTDVAAFSLIPPSSQTWNALTWRVDGMIVTNNHIKNSGAEGAYWGFTDDRIFVGAPDYQPVKFLDFVFAYNYIESAGNDGIQPCNSVEHRIHDNVVNGAGVEQNQFHETGMSHNPGSSGHIYNNYFKNVKMVLTIDSGLNPGVDLFASETTTRGIIFEGNIWDNGTVIPGGPTENGAMYIQTRSSAMGAVDWQVSFINNTLITDRALATVYLASGGFTMHNFKFFNNIVVKEDDLSDYDELDLIGPGTQPSTPTVNNLVYQVGSEAALLLTDVDNDNYRPSSLSSTAFAGSPSDVSALVPTANLRDRDGFPSGDYFGAYGRYDLQTIAPTVPDAAAATFSTAVTVESINESGGTIEFEANKEGLLYWVVVANNATAPTVAQVKAGGYLASGSILDGGTAGTGTISGLSQSTAYDLYVVFRTKWWVDQAAVTKVDFTTTADAVAPTLSGWEITNAQRGRIYFNSSEIITATTFSGFTIAGVLGTTKTVTGITINSGQTTGHYLTVSSNFDAIDYLTTIAYSGSGSNLQDGATNALASFTATSVTNSISGTRININLTNSGVNMGTGWNDVPVNVGSVGIQTLDADLVNSSNVSTGYSLEITDAFHNANNAVNGTGAYLTGNAGSRGIELYSTSAPGNTGTFRVAGLTAGKTFNIVYGTKATFNTPTGNVNINGAGGVSFTTAYTEYKQVGTVDVSGHINIVFTQLTSNASICMTAFIIILEP